MKSQSLFFLLLVYVNIVGSTFEKPSACGTTAGCYHDCDPSGQCTFVVTWKENGINIDFTVKAVNQRFGNRWMGIGFSHDNKMGDDAVTECVLLSNGTMVVKNSYNAGNTNIRLGDPDTGITNIVGSHVNNIFECSYSLQKTLTSQTFNLNNQYFLIFGSGVAYSDSTIRRHDLIPLVSSTAIDFLFINETHAAKQDFRLVKAHGSLMVIAWIFAVSIGVILTRFYRFYSPMLKLHRGLMTAAFLLTSVGFILIFIYVNDFSDLNHTDKLKVAHPIIGVIVTALIIINPIMALFRPENGTKNWFAFKSIHRAVGTMAFLLGVANCFLGVRMGKPKIPEYVIYILGAFVGWHLLFELIMWMQQYYVNKKALGVTATDDYKQQGSGVRVQQGSGVRVQQGSGVRVQPVQPAVPQISEMKILLLKGHVVMVFGFTVAIVMVIVGV